MDQQRSSRRVSFDRAASTASARKGALSDGMERFAGRLDQTTWPVD
jgi:hypothetical protein